ncbi:MAG: TerB family tellurite resistance protein [Rhodospirillales bacterium]|nr:TerB family tellurite resistance protein [Rhodospirillales bacterium]
MSIWGSLLGGTAGYALGGPLGALIGAAAGHALAKAAFAPEADKPPEKQIAFTIATVALAAKMAKADGEVCAREKAAFARLFRFDESEQRNVERVFDLATRSTAGYEAYARQVAGMFDAGAPALEELLDCLFHIAEANGEVTAEETAYLAEVARIFGIDAPAFEALRESQRGAEGADPWRMLGIARDTGEEAARKAWRELVRTHHPDVLTGQGMPAEFVALAQERLQKINAAWDRVRKAKGWK